MRRVKRTILLGKVEKEQKEVEIVLLLKKRSKNGRSSSENKNEFGSFWENTSSQGRQSATSPFPELPRSAARLRESGGNVARDGLCWNFREEALGRWASAAP